MTLSNNGMKYKKQQMKKTLTMIAIAATCNMAKAQNQDSALVAMSKIELSKIYIEEVKRVTEKMAFVAFPTIEGTVPNSKYTQKKFQSVKAKTDAYNTVLTEKFWDIVPYADKDQLIKCIVYLKGL